MASLARPGSTWLSKIVLPIVRFKISQKCFFNWDGSLRAKFMKLHNKGVSDMTNRLQVSAKARNDRKRSKMAPYSIWPPFLTISA